jgi:tetratricopeptide (TPR) repeat protein
MMISLTSCELLQPDDIINPNVDEETFLKSPNAMQSWVNGANKSFATSISSYVELAEILSDNYFNNYTQSSKVFDIPRVLHTDVDVTNFQRYIGTFRETANYGIDKVAKADAGTTQTDLFNLYYIKGYSFLLAGEYFVGLPIEEGGEIKDWKTNLNLAITTFTESLSYAESQEDKAFINTLIARVYHKLGDKANAVSFSNAALSMSNDFVKNVVFDGNNGVISSIQGYVYGTNFQPLPRLDFLDPKYFQLTALEQRPICIAKAEELYLILAEALLADNELGSAKQIMKDLLVLVKSRPVQAGINDRLEGRYNGGFKVYPNSSEYRIAASPEEPFRSNLILDRQSLNLISIPYVSGTSVNNTMIEGASSVDGLLEILYLMRQEIFFSEGRRASDLGLRLPVCEIEAASTPSSAAYIKAQIPSFIPLEQGMDAFDMDEEAKTVVIKHNMNKVIVANKSTEYVIPFFN